MNKFLLVGVLIVVLIASLGFYLGSKKVSVSPSGVQPTASSFQPVASPQASAEPSSSVSSNIRTDFSEGSCSSDSQCQFAGDACGGGHGTCTNQPEKYKNAVSTCDINENFPSNQGYKCGCIESLGKCGWSK